MMELLEIAWQCQQQADSQFEYCEDANGGDEWIMPEELEKRGCGDCEDLAIWRYECMLSYGVSADNMTISVGNVGNITHAVLDIKDDKGVWYRMEHNRPVVTIEPWMMQTPLHLNMQSFKIEYKKNETNS